MKNTLALLLTVAIVVGVVGVAPYARSLGTPAAPPGVAANDWVPLGDAAGFVIGHDPLAADRASPGTVRGYFVIRRSSTWLRVESSPPYSVQKTLSVP